MLYVVGMSHTIGMLDAFAPGFGTWLHEKSLRDSSAPVFETVHGEGKFANREPIAAALLINQRITGARLAWSESFGRGPTSLRCHPELLQLLRQVEADRNASALAFFLYGNEHSILSMVQHEVPFDFVLPSRADLRALPGRQVLPFRSVQAQIQKEFTPAIRTMTAARSAVRSVGVAFVLPPPPIPSSEYLLSCGEPYFMEAFRQSGVTPASIRLKYYLAYVAEVNRALPRLGITVIAVPNGVQDDEGFLTRQYWHGATHANAGYGERVCEQLYELVSQRRSANASV